MTITLQRTYPRTLAAAGGDVVLRPMAPGDAAAVLAFAQRLAPHDLLFLRRDISQPKVVAAWVEATGSDNLVTLLAVRRETVVGCATIIRDALSWSRHVGELRVIVDASARGLGLGQTLTHECFAVAVELGLRKLTAQMTVDQRAAIDVFEGLGFRAEALLKEQVQDREGRSHDIVILSQDVERFVAQQVAYGMTDPA